MRAGHLVCTDGLSGDMLLGTLVDAGVPIDVLRDAVDSLPIPCIQLMCDTVLVHGVVATRVTVDIGRAAPRIETLAQARRTLESSSLDPSLVDLATMTFERLARAEATVHGTEVGAVMLHELGDPDTIVDIVGVCAAVRALDVDRWTCGPVAVGSGRTKTAHGSVGIPTPAVTALLAGFVLEGGGRQRELTTPTGAALVSSLMEPTHDMPALRLTGVGRGASGNAESVLTMITGDIVSPNVLARQVVMIETTVDDILPEFIPPVLDRLREEGAHDAWAVPIMAKKGRPGFELKVIVDREQMPAVSSLLFRETPTIGLRSHLVDKHELPRYWIHVEVEGVQIAVKIAELEGAPVNIAPEFEQVKTAADQLRRPLDEVRHAATEAARHRLRSHTIDPASAAERVSATPDPS